MFDMIAFDADDTLWHNETLFSETQQRFRDLLAAYHDSDWINRKLFETETRNLEIFGYGIKGFALSMIETAVELTEGRVTGAEIQSLLDEAKGMLRAPVEVLPQVQKTLADLAKSYPLMVITKGDLFDQESKIARSGLGDHFQHLEIVSEKKPAVYHQILEKYALNAERFLMVGNSLKSDILPVVSLGGHAVHIPYHILWKHERIASEQLQDVHYHKLQHIGQLPQLIRELTEG